MRGQGCPIENVQHTAPSGSHPCSTGSAMGDGRVGGAARRQLWRGRARHGACVHSLRPAQWARRAIGAAPLCPCAGGKQEQRQRKEGCQPTLIVVSPASHICVPMMRLRPLYAMKPSIRYPYCSLLASGHAPSPVMCVCANTSVDPFCTNHGLSRGSFNNK